MWESDDWSEVVFHCPQCESINLYFFNWCARADGQLVFIFQEAKLFWSFANSSICYGIRMVELERMFQNFDVVSKDCCLYIVSLLNGRFFWAVKSWSIYFGMYVRDDY